jgi:[acyl-carrier-protein] S-malonyltransferase
VTVSFACLEASRNMSAGDGLVPASFVAGHSLGEYTALVAAGVLDFATTVYLARERGRLMHEAGQIIPGGMAAIIGLDELVLTEVCAETGARIANINCPGQIVISGAEGNLTQAMDLAKAKGAHRVIRLQVSGAFHTPLMQPAVDGMAEIIATLSFNQPTIPIIGNTTAQPLTTAESIKEELLRQLCNCVQWQRSVEYMVSDGVSTLIELGPGRVLAGLIKRIDRNVKIVNIGDAEAIRNITAGQE